ncbi:hypothetical protein ACHZ98_26395 [Streptomyces sp. MAR4 CNY-716]
MLRRFPEPPRSAEFSKRVTEMISEAHAAGGPQETVTVEWGGQRRTVEVIDLPLRDLYYNPATHRVRAQRSHDPSKDRELDSDPWSRVSQDYLQTLLKAEPANPARRDPDFDTLKESLREYGQTDPGLVTHHGILVNGNTRAAALREIQTTEYMSVGILPPTITWEEINAVELNLQLRKDHRRDYSYINRLLAMEEQAELGRTPEAIAKDFRIRESTYRQERWILTEIRDLIERSRSGGGVGLRLVDFEDHQEKLKELQRAHSKLKASDPEQAEIFKEARLAAILLGFSKTDVRHIDKDFLDEYLLQNELPPGLKKSSVQPEGVAIPGLGVTISGASSPVATARGINDEILRAKARVGTDAAASENDLEGAQELLEEAKRAFDTSIDQAGRDARIRKRKQMAPARLADACADIDQCVVDFVQARTSHSLDEDAFDDAVLKLRGSLLKLAQQAGRGIEEPGDGVSWLIEAVALPGERS